MASLWHHQNFVLSPSFFLARSLALILIHSLVPEVDVDVCLVINFMIFMRINEFAPCQEQENKIDFILFVRRFLSNRHHDNGVDDSSICSACLVADFIT